MALILVRMGELTLRRGYSRRLAERTLIRNIKEALRDNNITGRVWLRFSRIYVDVPDKQLRPLLEILSRVFGISSFSHVHAIDFSDLKDLTEKVEELVHVKVKDKSFAVRARRAGEHPFTSMDIAKTVGSKLLRYAKRVDLNNPEVEVNIEVRGWKAYVFFDKIKGVGGIPLGVEEPLLALVSGGYDSAVAAWYVMKRGAPVHYIFFNIGGPPHEEGALRVIKVIVDKWSYGYSPRMHIVDFREVISELRSKVEESYWNIVLKRFMYMASERVAREEGLRGLVTGESIGQVSSQTVKALEVASQAVNIMVLRPLIGMDKEEIIRKSRELGTYEYSSLIPEYCALVPKAPISHPDLKDVLKEEEKVDIEKLWRAVENRLIIDLRTVNVPPLPPKDVEIDRPPHNAILVDARSRDEYEAWHPQGAIHLEDLKPVKDKVYIFYCSHGKASKLTALYYRRLGYKAYSLKGGLKTLT